MMRFDDGDRVRFKGDPDEVAYVVMMEDGEDTYEIRPENSEGGRLDWIPGRLLELAPMRPQKGELWKHREAGTLFFISWVSEDGSMLRYTTAGMGEHVDSLTRVFDDRYVRVYPPLES